jgi:hypothetical protein
MASPVGVAPRGRASAVLTLHNALYLWALLTCWGVVLLTAAAYQVGVWVAEARMESQRRELERGLEVMELGLWRTRNATALVDSVMATLPRYAKTSTAQRRILPGGNP